MTRRRALALAVWAALAPAAAPWEPARAADGKAPAVDIRVIHALRTDAAASIDPELRSLTQLTTEKPFVRYNVFQVVDRKRLPLPKGRVTSYVSPDGRTLRLTLLDASGPPAAPRYKVRAEIAGPGNTEYLKLLEVTAGENEPFFVGGQSYAGGTLFLELVVVPGA